MVQVIDLKELKTQDLVAELLRRGWIQTYRERPLGSRMRLEAPMVYDPDSTRSS